MDRPSYAYITPRPTSLFMQTARFPRKSQSGSERGVSAAVERMPYSLSSPNAPSSQENRVRLSSRPSFLARSGWRLALFCTTAPCRDRWQRAFAGEGAVARPPGDWVCSCARPSFSAGSGWKLALFCIMGPCRAPSEAGFPWSKRGSRSCCAHGWNDRTLERSDSQVR
jgi:hypothetical protein